MIELASTLYTELWVSLASLLRSYTAAHGLNRREQATVELGKDQIIVRAGDRWLQLDRNDAKITWMRENRTSGNFELTDHSKLKDQSGAEEEMDMQAEAWARELML